MSIFNKKSNIIVMPSFGFTLDILKEALILNKNKNIYVFEEFSSEVFPYNHGVKTLNVEEFRKMLLEKDSRIALTLEERLFDIYGLPPHVDFMQNRRYVLDINGLKHKFPPFDENTRILRDIQRLKDKSHFRDWISQVYDDIWYETVSLNELSNMEYPGRPCVIQVAVGFGSKGIAIVKNESEWDKAKDNAIISAKKGENIFGKTVVNSDKWVVVEYFTGEEYAVDGFITDKGKPVITGIYQHVFKDANDTSDRVYLTSKSIMESYLDKVLDSIKPILKAKEAKSLFGTLFHLEFKDDKENGKHIFPIEWNIFRLGGYGLNKLTKFAFDINPYDYYFKQKEVNWKKILKKSDGKIHYFVLGIADEGQSSFNYDTEKFKDAFGDQLSGFMPVNRNIVFGAGYGKTDSWKDIDDWLRKNFSEFLKSEGERITQEDSKQLFEEAGPRAYMYEMFMKKLLSGAPFKPTFQSYRHFQASYVEGMKLSEICNGRTPKISPSGEICNVISMDESFVYNSARSSENEFK